MGLLLDGESLESDLYLRDDTELYRVIDTLTSPPTVWLENCRTLGLEKVPVRELRRRRLRRVIPARSVD